MKFIIPRYNKSLILLFNATEIIVKTKDHKFLSLAYNILYKTDFGINILNRKKETNSFLTCKRIKKDFDETLQWYIENPLKNYSEKEIKLVYDRIIALLNIYPFYYVHGIRKSQLFLLLYQTKHLSNSILRNYIDLSINVPVSKSYEKLVFNNLVHYISELKNIDFIFEIKDEYYLKFLLKNYSLKSITNSKKLKNPYPNYRNIYYKNFKFKNSLRTFFDFC